MGIAGGAVEWAVTYLAGAWLVLQLADLLADNLVLSPAGRPGFEALLAES